VSEGRASELTAIVAPLAEEVAAVLRRLTDPRAERRSELRAHRGSLAGRQVVVASTGDGARRAALGLRGVVDAWSPTRVLVLGVAAGLSEGLDIGRLVLGERLLDDCGEAPPPDLEWGRRAAIDALAGTVFSAGRIAVTAQEKRATRARLETEGAVVLDLESAALARQANATGRPFVVLRAVSDRFDESLPLDFNLFVDEDGGVRRDEVVRHVALRPHLLPALIELRRRVERCARALAAAAEEMVAA
jgi:adenosylhomocysteine nucleosidase